MLQYIFGLFCQAISALKSLLTRFSGLGTPSSLQESSPVSSGSQSWISLGQFQQATGLSATKAQDWYGPVKAACIEFDITTPIRITSFLAQVGHESGGFRYTREIWGPTPAQQRYEGRADLGNTVPGDGSKYRGRGLIQVTGRHNYTRVSAGLDVDALNNPEILEKPILAARSAAWWWHANGCNELADTGDFVSLTRRINGGTNGLDDRRERLALAQTYIQGVA